MTTLRRSDQAKMTYCKLVRLLDDSDTSYVSIRRDAAQEMAKLADLGVATLEAADKGATYRIGEIANKHFPVEQARDEDASNCISPPALGEGPS